MPNPILTFSPFSLAIILGQLWQQGGEVLLHCDVHCVLKRILEVANDIILYITIMTLVDVGSEKQLNISMCHTNTHIFSANTCL